MRQFQGSLGPLQELEGSRPPGPPRPSKKRAAEPVWGASVVTLPVRKSKGHASEHAGELVATAVIAALVLILAGWFAA